MADAANHFYYYIYNLQGDVIALADADTGKLVAKYTYDAWGKCVSVENATGFTVGNDNPFRFKGYYYDSETGLYYVNSRYYSPEIGRFVNADSFLTTDIADALSANMFAYCKNNPVNLYDDTGLFCLPAAIVGGVLNVGLTIAGAYIDAYIDGEPVNGKDLATDVIFSFTSGFIQSGFGSKFISKLFSFIDVGYAFFTTALRGGSLDDAMLNTVSSLLNVKVGDGFLTLQRPGISAS